MKSNPKQPSCKKRVRPWERLWWKKMWNPRWRPRNGCDGRLMVKILITTIQVNLVPLGLGTKFTWIVVIKIFTINLPSQPFLGRHLGFHIFFHHSLSQGRTLFLQLGCFGLDYNLHYILYSVFNGHELAEKVLKQVQEIETHSRDICFLLFYSNWTLHTTPIQLVSVLFIVKSIKIIHSWYRGTMDYIIY